MCEDSTPAISSPVVTLVDERPSTTSLKIAECFGKRHDHVVRDIRALIAECPEDFHKPNFGFMSRKVKIGNGAEREEPYYNVFFDGFILLVMGYTGKKALAMKLAYIAAFNAMREKLAARPELAPTLRAELKALVDAKLSTVPASHQKKARMELWSRFNRHFKIAAYSQLPPEKMAEAREYVIGVELRALRPIEIDWKTTKPLCMTSELEREKARNRRLTHQLAIMTSKYRSWRDVAEIFMNAWLNQRLPARPTSA